MEKMYSVKCPNTGRYIAWCDEHWYETTQFPNPIYTKEQAEAVVKQMQSHYTYNAILVDSEGNELVEKKQNPIKPAKPANSFFKNF